MDDISKEDLYKILDKKDIGKNRIKRVMQEVSTDDLEKSGRISPDILNRVKNDSNLINKINDYANGKNVNKDELITGILNQKAKENDIKDVFWKVVLIGISSLILAGLNWYYSTMIFGKNIGLFSSLGVLLVADIFIYQKYTASINWFYFFEKHNSMRISLHDERTLVVKGTPKLLVAKWGLIGGFLLLLYIIFIMLP